MESRPSSNSAISAPYLVEVRDLAKHYSTHGGAFWGCGGSVRAVDGISFGIRRGETLGLVGESGCGKTTAARAMLRLIKPTSGEVVFDGESLLTMPPSRLRAVRRDMQMVFQDSLSSMNPRMTVESIVEEGLLSAGVRARRTRRQLTADALLRVGLDPGRHLRSYPHELSGGQRQRVGIARALVLRPRFLVLDEAVSSLDVSVEAQIINILVKLRSEERHACLFISHDLSAVRHLSDRVAVMYLGRIVEMGPASSLYAAPRHPYTQALLASMPAAHPDERGPRCVLVGEVPGLLEMPRGCRFHPRCPFVMDLCREEEPGEVEVSSGHVSWCFLGKGDREPSRTDA